MTRPPRGTLELVVDGPDALARLRRPGARATFRRVRLAGPLADDATERALNRAFLACGCEEGSTAVLATLVGSVALGVATGFDGALGWWRVLVYLAVAAVVGKLVGLASARIRLRSILGRLEALSTAADAAGAPVRGAAATTATDHPSGRSLGAGRQREE